MAGHINSTKKVTIEFVKYYVVANKSQYFSVSTTQLVSYVMSSLIFQTFSDIKPVNLN